MKTPRITPENGKAVFVGKELSFLRLMGPSCMWHLENARRRGGRGIFSHGPSVCAGKRDVTLNRGNYERVYLRAVSFDCVGALSCGDHEMKEDIVVAYCYTIIVGIIGFIFFYDK